MEVVDGLQRIQAVLLFQSNELRAFGSLRREYTDHARLMRSCFVLQVNNLQTRAEVLRWYLELNATGTPHTEAELDRVRAMMGEDDENLTADAQELKRRMHLDFEVVGKEAP